MKYIIPVVPIGAPRMTKRDRWVIRPATTRYWAYRAVIQAHMNKNGWTVGTKLTITFYIPMAKTWSQKKKDIMNKMFHDQVPDTDNLIKAFLDSTLSQDKKVAEIHAYKFWSVTPSIEIEL